MPGEELLCWHNQFTSLQQNCRLRDQKKPQPLGIWQRCIPLKASESNCATNIYLTLAQFILQINLWKIATLCSQTRITLKNHLGLQSNRQWKEKHLLLNWAKCTDFLLHWVQLSDFTLKCLRCLHQLHAAEYNSSDSCNNKIRFKLIVVN